MTQDTNAGEARTTTTVSWLAPTIDIILLEVEPVLMYADASIHIGAGSGKESDPGPPVEKNSILSYGVGLGFGIRAAVAGPLSLGAGAGLAFDQVNSARSIADVPGAVDSGAAIFGFHGGLVAVVAFGS